MDGSRRVSEKARIVVVGCGGAGSNTVSYLAKTGLGEDIGIVALGTNVMHMKFVDVETRIVVGKEFMYGMGSGGMVNLGMKAVKMAEDRINRIIGKPDVMFIIAGLGGGTGTGATLALAEIARKRGIMTWAIVFLPFQAEGPRRRRALSYLPEIKRAVDTIIVLDNEIMLDLAGELPVNRAFGIVNNIVASFIRDISKSKELDALLSEEAYREMKKESYKTISYLPKEDIEKEEVIIQEVAHALGSSMPSTNVVFSRRSEDIYTSMGVVSAEMPAGVKPMDERKEEETVRSFTQTRIDNIWV